MFKNMVAFRLPNGWTIPTPKLEAALFKLRDRSCGAIERSACGWEPAYTGAMVHSVQGHHLFKMRVEEKMLPSSVVKKALKKRCGQIEAQQGRKPGKKEIRDIKEAIEMELLPKAFLKERFVSIWVDKKGMWIGIEASSANKATEAIDALRMSVDDLPEIQSIMTAESPSYVMRTWLANEQASHGFSIDDECELIGHGDVKASVKYARHRLDGQDVHQHLDEGKLPKSLGVTFEEQISFVFNESLEIKKIEVLEMEDSQGQNDKPEDGFDANFFAMAETMSMALLALVKACGGEADQSDGMQGADE